MTSRDRDKPTAEMLRRSLASSSRAGEACPDAEILAAYSEGSLDTDESARYDLHFSRCARCREQLAAIARADELVAGAEEERERAAGWSWLWDWRRLVPAFAVLMIAAGIWYVERPARVRVVEQPSLVAESRPAEPPMSAVTREASPEIGGKFSAVPAAVPSGADSLKPAAPSSTLGRLQSAEPEPPPPPKPVENIMEKKENARVSTNLPLRSRDYIQLDTVTNSASPAKQAGSEVARQNNGVGGAPESVEVIAAAPLVQRSPAAQVRAAPPMQTGNGAGNGADSGTNGGVSSSAFGARQIAPKNKQMTAGAVAGVATAPIQAATLEEADKRSSKGLIHTPDPQILWRISEGGFVERSIDGGASWEGKLPVPNAHLVAGSAPKSQVCWLVGDRGIILLSADGTTWKTIPPPAVADFVDVAANDASSATVSAVDGRKFTTADGGKHWNPAP